jgi:hypothetical protein
MHNLLTSQLGGWAGSTNISESAYWPLQNQWVYMMGDSTQRQVWAAFVSPFQSKSTFLLCVHRISAKLDAFAFAIPHDVDNEFERNAKEWTRENVRQSSIIPALLCHFRLAYAAHVFMSCYGCVQCARQYPHRKEHPSGGYFPEEGEFLSVAVSTLWWICRTHESLADPVRFTQCLILRCGVLGRLGRQVRQQ